MLLDLDKKSNGGKEKCSLNSVHAVEQFITFGNLPSKYENVTNAMSLWKQLNLGIRDDI